jgi:hypothetical protein
VTAQSHGLSDGDIIKIDNVVGMTEVNGKIWMVGEKTTNQFVLYNLDDTKVDGSAFKNYLYGGEIRKMVDTVSNLDHLEGETVTVQIDGGVPAQATYTVVNGTISLNQKAAVIHVGLPYYGKVVLLKLSGGSEVGQTKSRRIYLSTLRVFKSLGMQIGQDENNMQTVYFAKMSDPLRQAPELFTGDVEKFFGGWWSKTAEVVIKQVQPLPLWILAVVMRSEEEEK